MTPSHEVVLPPLIGDGHGRFKVKIMGNSGVGKVKYVYLRSFRKPTLIVVDPGQISCEVTRYTMYFTG